MKYIFLLMLALMPNTFLAMKRSIEESKATDLAQQIARLKAEKYKKEIEEFYPKGPISKEIKDRGVFLKLRKLATHSHYTPILKDLLEKNLLDPNSKFIADREMKYRLFNEAVIMRAHENVEILLRHGAKANYEAGDWERDLYSPDIEEKKRPLEIALDEPGHCICWLQILLKGNADPNKHSSETWLPLIKAVEMYAASIRLQDFKYQKEARQAMEVLIQHGANPDLIDVNGDGQTRFVHGTQIPISARSLASHYKFKNILLLFDKAKKQASK